MEEVALKLGLHDEKTKQKAIRIDSGLSGIDMIDMNNKEKKLTTTGDMDDEYPPPMPTNYARVVAIEPTVQCVIC